MSESSLLLPHASLSLVLEDLTRPCSHGDLEMVNHMVPPRTAPKERDFGPISTHAYFSTTLCVHRSRQPNTTEPLPGVQLHNHFATQRWGSSTLFVKPRGLRSNTPLHSHGVAMGVQCCVGPETSWLDEQGATPPPLSCKVVVKLHSREGLCRVGLSRSTHLESSTEVRMR